MSQLILLQRLCPYWTVFNIFIESTNLFPGLKKVARWTSEPLLPCVLSKNFKTAELSLTLQLQENTEIYYPLLKRGILPTHHTWLTQYGQIINKVFNRICQREDVNLSQVPIGEPWMGARMHCRLLFSSSCSCWWMAYIVLWNNTKFSNWNLRSTAFIIFVSILL